MAGIVPLLREIHRLRTLAHDLGERIEQAPRQLKLQEIALQKAEEGLKNAQDDIKKLKVLTLEKEASIKSVLAVIKKHEKQLNEATAPKEFEALKNEIKSEKESVNKLENEALDAMSQVEEKTAKLPDVEKQTKKVRDGFAQFKTDQAENLKRYQVEKEKALAALTEIEAQIPEDILANYQRGIKTMGHDALSAVENRICVACYTEITAQMYNELSRSNFVNCKSCGRILYLPG